VPDRSEFTSSKETLAARRHSLFAGCHYSGGGCWKRDPALRENRREKSISSPTTTVKLSPSRWPCSNSSNSNRCPRVRIAHRRSSLSPGVSSRVVCPTTTWYCQTKKRLSSHYGFYRDSLRDFVLAIASLNYSLRR
jgi:hypothetical protein